MPPPCHNNPHWQVFSGTSHVPAGAVGYIPYDWVVNHKLHGVPIDATFRTIGLQTPLAAECA
jgi:hypothetical protein